MELITGGCSFSDLTTTKTWPHWLAQSLNANLTSTGLSSTGNKFISRRVHHAVNEKLKTTDPKDIIVGVMWSGPSRAEFYHKNYIKLHDSEGWVQNPVVWPEGDSGGWTIMNAWWKIKLAKFYYTYFYDEIGSQVLTLESIISLQNYLKLNNIKYFMSIYHDEVFTIRNHPQLDWLYEQIDWDHFLSGKSCYHWCKFKSGLPYPIELHKGISHPSEEQHKAYTQKVIRNFLNKKYKI